MNQEAAISVFAGRCYFVIKRIIADREDCAHHIMNMDNYCGNCYKILQASQHDIDDIPGNMTLREAANKFPCGGLPHNAPVLREQVWEKQG